MPEALEIKREYQANVLKLSVTGRIDAYWADQLEAALNEEINAGHYDVVLDLSRLGYISSAGIRVLLLIYKQLRALHGTFVIAAASDNVTSVLQMSGIAALLSVPAAPVKKTDNEATTVQDGNLLYSIRALDPDSFLRCRLTGNPDLLLTSSFKAIDCRQTPCPESLSGIGIGALGLNVEDCRKRAGEFIAVGGAVTYAPTDNSNRPDYMTPAGRYAPQLLVLYGILWEGGYSHVFDFEAEKGGESISLATLVAKSIELAEGADAVAMVIIGETAGLVGATLRRSPFQETSGESPYSFPAIRDSIYFSTAKIHTHAMTVTAGIVSRNGTPNNVNTFTRPLSAKSALRTHFHTAVFPYRPVRKDQINPGETMRALLEAGQIMSIVHLINDDRDIVGIGESEFVRGSCWVGRIAEIAADK